MFAYPGSPFEIEIHPQNTHGKIKVWGPGLENGVFPEYQGHFFVDATGAGGGELHVSVMGIKGIYFRIVFCDLLAKAFEAFVRYCLYLFLIIYTVCPVFS